MIGGIYNRRMRLATHALDSLPPGLAEALDGPRRIEVLQSRSTPHTAVHQLTLGDGRTVWCKQYLRKLADAAKEYAFLTDAWAAGLPVVEPLALLADRGALVTRHAGGSSLSSKVRQAFDGTCGAAQLRETAEDCARSGEFLARWHSRTITPSADDPSRVVQIVETLAPREVRRFAELAAEAEGEETFRVRAHGDFGPHNILADGAAAVILDPSFPDDLDVLGNLASPCEDAGRFVACLHDTTARTPGSRVSRTLIDAFLGAYNAVARNPIDPSSPALRLFTARHLLQNLLDWRSRPTPAFAVLRRFERWVQQEESVSARS